MATRWPPAVRPGLLRVRHNHTDHELRHLHHLPKKPSTPVLRGVSCRLYKSARYASTSPKTAFTAAYPVTRTKNFIFGTTIGVVLVFGYLYVTDTRAGKSTVCEHLNSYTRLQTDISHSGIHQWLVVPSLKRFYPDAEDAHEAGNQALKALYQFGLHPRERDDPDKAGDLEVEVFGHMLKNPIGTSAGIDKHAEIPDPLLALGPAIIEIGGTTPYPQDGNPKPRVFRLPSQKALINRYGLNSEGKDAVAMRLRQRVREFAYAHGFGIDEVAEQRVLDGEAGVPPGSLTEGKLLAVQVAKNKFTPDDDLEAVKSDYVSCVETLARYADIIVVNVSSPNTPGLRGLQHVDRLTNILTGVVAAAKNANRKQNPAIMVKVSPDEDGDSQVAGICEAIKQSGCAGVIVSNTTLRRPDPLPAGYMLPEREAALMLEQGGYSGPQLFKRTVALVKRYRTILDEDDAPAPPSLEHPPSSQPSDPKIVPKNMDIEVASQIRATTERDTAHLKPSTPSQDTSSKSQPLLRLPERNSPSSPSPSSSLSHPATPPDRPPALSSSSHINQLPSPPPSSSPARTSSSSPSSSSSAPADTVSGPTAVTASTSAKPRTVIFASGGITNGRQALEVLEAGASVAMVYTALVFGGVGTISRVKEELREEMKKRGSEKG